MGVPPPTQTRTKTTRTACRAITLWCRSRRPRRPPPPPPPRQTRTRQTRMCRMVSITKWSSSSLSLRSPVFGTGEGYPSPNLMWEEACGIALRPRSQPHPLLAFLWAGSSNNPRLSSVPPASGVHAEAEASAGPTFLPGEGCIRLMNALAGEGRRRRRRWRGAVSSRRAGNG